MVQKNIQTSAPKKKTVPKKLVKGGSLQRENFPKLVALKWRFFAQSILACLVLHVWFLTIPGCTTENAAWNFLFSLGGCLLVEASEKIQKNHPKWEVVWSGLVCGCFAGGGSLVWASDLTAVVFRKPRLWTRFVGFKAFIRHSFHKVHSRMVSIAIVILTVLSPYSIKPTQLFPRTHPTNFNRPRGRSSPHLNTIRSKARSPLTSRKAK